MGPKVLLNKDADRSRPHSPPRCVSIFAYFYACKTRIWKHEIITYTTLTTRKKNKKCSYGCRLNMAQSGTIITSQCGKFTVHMYDQSLATSQCTDYLASYISYKTEHKIPLAIC